MNVVITILQLAGSLAILLYGMKLMSNGVQKSAGDQLQRILSIVTSNPFLAILVGFFITIIIQSSGATTVMVVTFVNAGLLSLQQSIGVIFGANIGTTITAWIVAIFGFSFKIENFALPIFGLGFFLTLSKRSTPKNIGEALMGFGLLFMGLSMLSASFTFEPEQLEKIKWFSKIQSGNALSILVGFIIGTIITAILHSSSAFSAIVITMAMHGMVTWEFAASLTLGSNIGSTIDAILAAMGNSTDAKRAALIHVMFNVFGTVIVLVFFHPFLNLIDFLTPKRANIAIKISILHTVFKTLSTVVLLPFMNQLYLLSKKIIKQTKKEMPNTYHLEYQTVTVGKENVPAHIVHAEKEIADMADLVTEMFDRIQRGFMNRNQTFIDTHLEALEKAENYADQMHEALSRFIVHIEHLPVTEKQLNNLSLMLQIVDELEGMTDECFSIGLLIQKSIEKKMKFARDDTDRLIPYVELVRQFLQFIHININKHLNEDKMQMARELEDQIDLFRKNLKKVARKRLEDGADVKAELLYIDLVRQIEKIGDHAFTISGALCQTM